MSTTQAMPPTVNSENDEIEIRLSDIVQFLKGIRWRLARWFLFFLAIGILYALSKQEEFTATVRVMPELKGTSGPGGLNDLKSLAGLAGVNLDNASGPEAIRPDLYPDIVQSIPFTLYLLSQPVTKGTKNNSLQEFLIQKSQDSWLGRLSGSKDIEKPSLNSLTTNNGAVKLTATQEELSKQLSKRVKAEIDKKSGIITITSLMPDPTVAAFVANQTLKYLTNYVTNYRTGKARKQVQFLQNQVNDAQNRYQSTEFALSNYRDRNRSLFLNTAKIEEQRLQADYQLAQTVYNELSKQLAQAKIKVQEEAPVFQILEPARVPLKKSAPNRAIIILGFSVAGIIIGLMVSFIQFRFLQD